MFASGHKTSALRCTVNDVRIDVQVSQDETLLTTLRDRLGLTGAKGACLEGICGTCLVIVDGEATNSCLVLSAQMQGKVIETVEGLATDTKLHILQQKFLESGATQCGYCTPGLIMAAKALLDGNPHPDRQTFFDSLEGNICRCTGYQSICQAIREAAEEWE